MSLLLWNVEKREEFRDFIFAMYCLAAVVCFFGRGRNIKNNCDSFEISDIEKIAYFEFWYKAHIRTRATFKLASVVKLILPVVAFTQPSVLVNLKIESTSLAPIVYTTSYFLPLRVEASLVSVNTFAPAVVLITTSMQFGVGVKV